jgi:hypothetical protein
MDRPCSRRRRRAIVRLSLPTRCFSRRSIPHIQTKEGQREAGQLLLAEDRWLLVVGDGTGTALIDLKSGARIRDARDAIRIRFRAWRIVQKGLGDEYDTICRHVVKRQSKVGFARD